MRSRTPRRGRLAALVAVTALGGLAGCGTSHRTIGSASELRFGYDSQAFSVGDVATRLAIGRYAKQTHKRLIDLTFGSPENEVTALVRGDADLASVRLPDLIKAVSAGAPIHAVAILQTQREFVLVARPPIRTLGQLAGAAIAENGPGTDSETLAKVAVRRAGLTSRVRLVSIPNGPARAAALERGSVQAAALRYADYLRVRERVAGLRVLVSMPQLLPHTIAQTLVVSDAFAARNGAALKVLVRDAFAEFRFLYGPGGRPAFVTDARRDVLASDPERLAEATYDYYRKIRIWPTSSRLLSPAGFVAQERVYVRTGQLAHTEPFAKVWNTSFS